MAARTIVALMVIATADAFDGIGFDADQTHVNVTIMLGYNPDNLRELFDTLANVSEPGHPQRGKYISRNKALSLLQPHPAAHDAVVAWRDARGLSHRQIDEPHQLFRVISLTVTEASRALPTECTVGELQQNGAYAQHHAVTCTDVDAHHVATSDHVTHVVIGGHVHATELERQRRALHRAAKAYVAEHSRERRQATGSPTSPTAAPTASPTTSSESVCNALAYGTSTSPWVEYSSGTPYVPIPLLGSDGPFTPNVDIPLASMLTPNADLNLTWQLTLTLSMFSGYAGYAFDASRIPFVPAPECIFPLPIDLSRLSACPTHPFEPQTSEFGPPGQVSVYFNSTSGNPLQVNHVFTFNQSTVENNCGVIENAWCTSDWSTINYTFAECNFDVVIPSTLWFGEFYVTVVITNTSGYSVAQTASTVYFTGPNTDVISRTAATPAAVQPLVMPTQTAAYYGSNNLPVVQSRKALSGSTPAVLLITPDAYFSPSDFAAMLTASNSTAYTMYPLLPGQTPVVNFETQPQIDTAAVDSSLLDQVLQTDDDNNTVLAMLQQAKSNVSHGVVGYVANNASAPDDEFTLDTQFIGTISRTVSGQAYSTGYFFSQLGAYLTNNGATEVAQLLLMTGSLFAALYGEQKPDVISMSFGVNVGAGQHPPLASIIPNLEPVLAALGASGVTLIVAAGDGGAVADPGTTYLDLETTQWTMPFSCNRSIFWPAGSPYVTAVGGTQLALATTASCVSKWPPNTDASAGGHCVQEIAQSSYSAGITSGGGFSNLASRPSWQSAAVQGYATYLQSYITSRPASDGPYFSEYPSDFATLVSRRGYPDVAAIGHFCNTILAGALSPVDGTSCAAPEFAGMISLLNSQLSAMGKPHLGFLNPTLYAAPSSVFNDITDGYNGAPRGVPGTSCTTAYPAAPGWDAVTGLGSLKVKPFLDWHLQHLNSGGSSKEKLSASDDIGIGIGAVVIICIMGIVILVACYGNASERKQEPDESANALFDRESSEHYEFDDGYAQASHVAV